MKQAFLTMLDMQSKMNSKVHDDWISQQFEWYRAIWIECAELMDHFGYKWWKKQDPDMEQVNLEIIDIWHFGMSALFKEGLTQEALADAMVAELDARRSSGLDLREAAEAVAQDSLARKSFSVSLFWDLMDAAGMSFDTLYQQYVGKNVLNFFRQDNGYKQGSYVKQWQGREDNEHLVEILAELDDRADDFAAQVYQALGQRYQVAAAQG